MVGSGKVDGWRREGVSLSSQCMMVKRIMKNIMCACFDRVGCDGTCVGVRLGRIEESEEVCI